MKIRQASRLCFRADLPAYTGAVGTWRNWYLRNRRIHRVERLAPFFSVLVSSRQISSTMLRTTLQPFAMRSGVTSRLPSRILRNQLHTTPFQRIAEHPLPKPRLQSPSPSSKPFSFTSRQYTTLLRSLPSKTTPKLKSQPRPQTILHRLRTSIRNFSSTRTRLNQKVTEQAGQTTAEDTSLRGRLKKLSREYGWTVVGVYFALSVLDFPFFFLLVKAVGTERVGMLSSFPSYHKPFHAGNRAERIAYL